ncbi:MAG TPA: hypothetical protein VJ756_15735 [Terriglobales bacterium]|nr:hypothetical protein [Terriglobales bacterium]
MKKCFRAPEDESAFTLRLYDDKVLNGEPTWTVEKSESTPPIVEKVSEIAPRQEDEGKKVERDFPSVEIPRDAPERIYAVIWRTCEGQQLIDAEHLKPVKDTENYGGEFFRLSCPAGAKISTGRCTYSHE